MKIVLAFLLVSILALGVPVGAAADPLPFYYDTAYRESLGPMFAGHYDQKKPDEYYASGLDVTPPGGYTFSPEGAIQQRIPINLEYVANAGEADGQPSMVTYPFTAASGDWALWWDVFDLCQRSIVDGTCLYPATGSMTVQVYDAGTGKLLQTLVDSPAGDASVVGAHFAQPIYLVITANGYWTAFIMTYQQRSGPTDY